MAADVRMRGFRRRADLHEAIAWLDEQELHPGSETIALAEGHGRVLADDLVSAVSIPPFRRSAMDGWALRGERTFGATITDPIAFPVVGLSLPGRPYLGPLPEAACIRIMTGAPVPDGCDAVLKAEEGRETDGVLQAQAAVPPGKNVGAIGEDIPSGRTVLERGRVLRPQDIGLIASIGHGAVAVVARPRVRLLVTGDELLEPGETPSATQIVDSNTPMLRGLVARDGGVLERGEILADQADRITAALQDATADVVLVSGGSSVGQEDHAPRLVAELGELPYHGFAVRPAAPAGIGRIAGRLVFLLPGNPVSCLSAYDLLASRIVRRLAGHAPDLPYPKEQAALVEKISSVIGRVDYVRVKRVEGGLLPIGVRGASRLSSTTDADGFVLVPRDSEGWPEGTQVTMYAYDIR